MRYAVLVFFAAILAAGIVGWSRLSKPIVLGFDVAVDEITTGRDKSDNTKELLAKINNLFNATGGKYSLYVYRPGEKTGYGINENLIMTAASMMKVPILIATEKAINKGLLQADQIYVLQESDKREGSGPIAYYDAGTKLSVATLMTEMGKKSDNTAPVVLTEMLGTDQIEAEVKALGMINSSFKNNTSTALDMARMWSMVYKGDGLSDEQKNRIWDNLSGSIYEDRIPSGIPDGVRVIHKVGTGDGVWGDGGIIMATKPFILVIMNKDVDQNQAGDVVTKVTKLVWDHENKR